MTEFEQQIVDLQRWRVETDARMGRFEEGMNAMQHSLTEANNHLQKQDETSEKRDGVINEIRDVIVGPIDGSRPGMTSRLIRLEDAATLAAKLADAVSKVADHNADLAALAVENQKSRSFRIIWAPLLVSSVAASLIIVFWELIAILIHWK